MTQATTDENPSSEGDSTSNEVMAAADGPPDVSLIADGVRSREGYAVCLEMFEGPLDLLLHLVRRHELDVLDIPISFVAGKYVEYLEFARALDIEIAGEYLVMAATLAFLKSRELLPAAPEEEEAQEGEEELIDPRQELIRRLIEYEKFKNAGEELGRRPVSGRDVFTRGGEIDVATFDPGLAPVTLFRLAEAYNRVLDRAQIRQDHHVEIEPLTVRQRMKQLSLILADKPQLTFESLFLEREWSSERELRITLVVTLMSILEMVKLGVMNVHQPIGSMALSIERTVAAEDMDKTLASFIEDGTDVADEESDAPASEEEEPAPPTEPEIDVEAVIDRAEAELLAANEESSGDSPEDGPVVESEQDRALSQDRDQDAKQTARRETEQSSSDGEKEE